MPTSDYHQISDVLHVVEQIKPARILDVGIGFGKWGLLCHEILDVYYERLQPATWTTHVEGIEIHEAYRNALWPIAYKHVHIGDARNILPRLPAYDLILCCDVIEHFEKSDGLRLIDLMLRHAPILIITSPAGHAPQGAKYGNVFETHLSSWTRSDFDQWPHRYKLIGFTFMAIIAADFDRIAHLDVRQPLEVLGVKNSLRELFRMIGRRLSGRIRRPAE
jgi:SAM-dependent methyltransferase